MKKFLVLFVLVACLRSVYAQDLLITNDGDTLNCEITSIKGDFIRFNFMKDGEFRRTLIPTKDVAKYATNYYDEAEISSDLIVGEQDYNKFRFSATVGYGYRIGKISEDAGEFHDYIQKIKSGINLDFDAIYYWTETTGVGIKYNQFNANNSMDNVSVDVDQDGLMDYGRMSDDISIYYLGPVFSSRLLSAAKKNAFITNIGVGYLGYKNCAELAGFKSNYKRGAVGLFGELAYQLGLSEDFSFVVSLSYTMGTLTKIDIDHGNGYITYDLDKEEYESLNRFNLSLGFVLHK